MGKLAFCILEHVPAILQWFSGMYACLDPVIDVILQSQNKVVYTDETTRIKDTSKWYLLAD